MTYTLTGKPYWDSNVYPVFLVNGSAPTVKYTVNYTKGTITFASALNPAYPVTVNNFTYSTLTEVGDFKSWKLDAKLDVVDVTGFQDGSHVKLATFKGWTASAEHYFTTGYWFTEFDLGKTFYFVFYYDSASSKYFVGNGLLNLPVDAPHDQAIMEPITLEGTDALTFFP